MDEHYGQFSDTDLLQLLKADDEKALSALYHKYWNKLFSVAAHQLDNLEIAEECVHDIFLSLWNKRAKLELKHSLSTYLAASVKYMVIRQRSNLHRLKYHLDQLSADTIDVLSPSADHLILEKELFASIETAIEKLPEKCRIVFRLAKQEGKSHKEIASELNIAEKTVESHLRRANKELRDNLSGLSFIIFIFFYGKF